MESYRIPNTLHQKNLLSTKIKTIKTLKERYNIENCKKKTNNTSKWTY